MKRSFILACLLATTTAWASTEYLRPTADVDSTNSALKAAACSGSATSAGSVSNSAVYSGKSGAIPTGASATQSASTSSSTGSYKMRVFTNWQTTSNTYTSFTVSVSAMCAITDDGDARGGRCGAAYSTDNGSTATLLYSYVTTSTNSDSQTTWTATITGATPSNVQVAVCALAASDSGAQGDSATITIYDIGTTGTYTASVIGFPGIIRSKTETHECIWRKEWA